MKYAKALEINESAAGLDISEMSLDDLLELIDEIPGWDYPLAEECMVDLARRAGISPVEFFDDSDRDYSDLWLACAEALGVDF